MNPAQVLDLIPQKEPFRFINTISFLDEERIETSYRFRDDEYFYRGHFPGKPLTPGVILIETMAQAGVVALGLYLISLEIPPEEIPKYTTLFTDCQIEFNLPVLPGQLISVKGQKMFWRRMKIRSKVQMFLENGDLVAEGIVSGMGIRHE